MSRSTAKILQLVNLVGMVFLMVCSRTNPGVMSLIALIAIGISVWLSSCLRCPHCGAWPRRTGWFDEYCPRCGEYLGD